MDENGLADDTQGFGIITWCIIGAIIWAILACVVVILWGIPE